MTDTEARCAAVGFRRIDRRDVRQGDARRTGTRTRRIAKIVAADAARSTFYNMIISDIKVELIDKMGSDLSVVNAARVSFGKFKNELDDGDKRLIGYLARNGHWTPFGHGTVSFRVKAPIFVARQLVKHQAGLVWNEVSRRYVDSEPEFYFPTSWRARAANVKQGSSDESVTDEGIVDGLMKAECENSLEMYLYLMKEYNVAPEQARMILPLNTMTEWVWTGSLMAWARVCNLRLDPHAQKECRDVAQLINNHMKELFPVSWKALVNDTLSAAAENLA